MGSSQPPPWLLLAIRYAGRLTPLSPQRGSSCPHVVYASHAHRAGAATTTTAATHCHHLRPRHAYTRLADRPALSVAASHSGHPRSRRLGVKIGAPLPWPSSTPCRSQAVGVWHAPY